MKESMPNVKTISRANSLASGKWWIVGLINLVLCSYFIDDQITANPVSRAAPLLSLRHHGTIQIDHYHELTIDKSFIRGHYYSDKAPLTTYLALPFYELYCSLKGKCSNDREDLQTAIRIGGFVASTIPFLILLLLALRNLPPAHYWIVVLSFYGTLAFVYTGTMFGHIAAGFCVVVSLLLLQKRPFVSGIFLGLGFAFEYQTALALPLWMFHDLLRSRNFQRCFYLGLGFLPGLTAILIYNFYLSGDFLKMPYEFVATSQFSAMKENLGFKGTSPEALWGLTFGSARGLFFFSPALLYLLGLIVKSKKSITETLTDPTILFFLCSLLLFSSYFMWWGGWAFSARYLIPAALLVLFTGLGVVKTPAERNVLLVLGAMGVLVNWTAKATLVYMVSDKSTWPIFTELLPRLFIGPYNPANMLTTWGAPPSWACFLWLPLFFILHWLAGKLVTGQTGS